MIASDTQPRCRCNHRTWIAVNDWRRSLGHGEKKKHFESWHDCFLINNKVHLLALKHGTCYTHIRFVRSFDRETVNPICFSVLWTLSRFTILSRSYLWQLKQKHHHHHHHHCHNTHRPISSFLLHNLHLCISYLEKEVCRANGDPYCSVMLISLIG